MDFIGNFQTFVQLGVRLGVCQCRDTEAAHLEGPCRVGATWAHIAKCDDFIRIYSPNWKNQGWLAENLSIQEIGLGCNRTGRQKKCHALPNKFFWLCNIGFQASETLASCWGHFCEWYPGWMNIDWQMAGSWAESGISCVTSDQMTALLPFWTFDLVFNDIFSAFTFCIFFLWMQFLCIYDCPCISAASALVKILFQTQVWE